MLTDLIAMCWNLSPPCASLQRTPTLRWRRSTTFSQVTPSRSFSLCLRLSYCACALFKRIRVCNGSLLSLQELSIMCHCVCVSRTWGSFRLKVAQRSECREWQQQKKSKCDFVFPKLWRHKHLRQLSKPKLVFGAKLSTIQSYHLHKEDKNVMD